MAQHAVPPAVFWPYTEADAKRFRCVAYPVAVGVGMLLGMCVGGDAVRGYVAAGVGTCGALALAAEMDHYMSRWRAIRRRVYLEGDTVSGVVVSKLAYNAGRYPLRITYTMTGCERQSRGYVTPDVFHRCRIGDRIRVRTLQSEPSLCVPVPWEDVEVDSAASAPLSG